MNSFIVLNLDEFIFSGFIFYFKYLRRTKKSFKKSAIRKLNPDSTLYGLVLKYIFDEKFNFLKIITLAIIILHLPGLDVFMNKMLSNVSIYYEPQQSHVGNYQ